MKEQKEVWEQLKREIEQLPSSVRHAFYWLIKNIDVADQLTKGEPPAEQEIAEMLRTARKRNDDKLLMLVLYQQAKAKARSERESRK